MRVWAAVAVSAGILLAVSGCTSPAPIPSASPESLVSENGNVGLCHSVSVALTTLNAVQLGYQDGTLDRATFDYMISAITKNFDLLRIMHHDSTLQSTAADLRSAIGDLASAGSEPDFGDTSELGQSRAALSESCDVVDAPLSVVP